MFPHRSVHFVSLIVPAVWVMAAPTITGCAPINKIRDSGYISNYQGGDGLLLELPFPAGVEKMCTQGAHGSHSHNISSTLYDLDLDTDNSVDEELFAPVSGTAYVHMESATSGFGYHINIDLGDNTYVVMAHLSDIFVSDGDEVAVGELLGYEGNTGNSTGDHVHIGLHEGDASQSADHGVSVPATYWVADASESGGMSRVDSESFVCGIRSEGDGRDGHFYESDLSINLWHPNGALIKTPDNARVYVLDGGNTRWIENESTFWGLGYDFDEVVLISEKELACYGDGSDITGETLVDAAFDNEGQLWLIVGASNDPGRYRARVRGTGWEYVMASWGLGYSQSNWPEELGDQADYMANWDPVSEYAGLRDGTLVTEEDASDVWFISDGYALPIRTWDVYLLQNYFHRSVLVVEDGIVGELHLAGSCATDQMCLDLEAVTTCGGGLDINGSNGSGGDDGGENEGYNDGTSQDDGTKQDDGTNESDDSSNNDQEDNKNNDVSVLTVDIDYPSTYPLLELTVQPIYAVSSLGDEWLARTSVTNDDEVSWSQEGDFGGLLGVRFNVNVDSDGNGSYDDWYCYGHYESAYLEYGVAVDITLDKDAWDENDLVTWSPGSEDQTELGCSALLWFGSTSSISQGAVF